MSKLLEDIDALSDNMKNRLRRADLIDPLEVMLMGVEGLSKKLNMSLPECEKLVQIIALGSMPEVEDFHNRFNSIDTFTSGDDELDDLLGGGIREQSLFEIVGAASVGKSQLLMQTLITVQLPFEEGGLDAHSILIHTGKAPPTDRLQTMSRVFFPSIPPEDVLSHISILQVTDIQSLQHALDFFIPRFLTDSPKSKAVRLIAIDSFGELSRQFNNTGKGLSTRNAHILRVVDSLKRLIHTYRLAAIVVNGVTDAVQADQIPTPESYTVQSRYFSGQTVHNSKTAQLGMGWANSVHLRLMLVRTLRKVHVDLTDNEIIVSSPEGEAQLALPPYFYQDDDRRFKKPRTQRSFNVHKRRAHIVYSSYRPPGKCEFYILPIGLRSLHLSVRDKNASPVPTAALTPAISQSFTQTIDDEEAEIWASIPFSDDDDDF